MRKKIRNNKKAVLHNGDIYPPDFQTVRAENWYVTDKSLTIKERLIPRDKKYWLEPTVISSISIVPFGMDIRQKFIDPMIDKKELVTWRNYEASYDVAQLEPTTARLIYTYALQEYFVPVENFDAFLPKMKEIFSNHNVNIINVSIRHSMPEKDTYLAWASREVFSFVIYYKQGTSQSSKEAVMKWTRELIDSVIALEGTYYLPYQIHATNEQFKKAYPNYKKFFEIKAKYDPTYKFRNKLWDSYYSDKSKR